MAQSTLTASIIMCAGLATTYMFLPDGGSVAIYRTAAIGAALSIGFGIYLQTHGIRSLMRTDLIMLVALFGLTLVEFFFPQSAIELMIRPQSATQGVEALFLGFCGLIIGRNFITSTRPIVVASTKFEWSPKTIFSVYVGLFFASFLYVLVTVGFNPVELVTQMLGPRFSQPWSRGALGGWAELPAEYSGLIRYLIPAFAGVILANPSAFRLLQKLVVTFGLGFTLFWGFASGTRNVFCIYLLTFVVSYISRKRGITWKRVLIIISIASFLLYFAAYYMLEFRKIGLENYNAAQTAHENETFFVDNNLPVISRLTEVFPSNYHYLGLELASFAILHPVPRALWPSKPEHLSISAEDALGMSQLTLSSTFVGEAYMMGGYPAILLMGLLFGWVASWWNRFGLHLRSSIGVILYASGFFAATISMRSILWTTTAILPTIAIWLYSNWRATQAVSHIRLTSRPHRPRSS
jgi:oligosaccharide repeat unit polymerase